MPPDVVELEEIAGASAPDAQRPTATAGPVVPDELRDILNRLWNPDNRENADAIMRELQAFIDANPGADFTQIARFEKAKAYSHLKDDEASARYILEQLAAENPESRVGQLSQQWMRYMEAGQYDEQWRQVIEHSHQDAYERYENYRNTSWLALPVKVTRWVGYARKQYEFNRNRNNVKEFRLWYEEIGAPFVPPPDILFNRFEPATGVATSTSHIALQYCNPESWYGRWQVLTRARRSIDVQYFIVDEDIFGHALLGALLVKAREGVRVRLLLDARGTATLTRRFLGQNLLQKLYKHRNVDIRVYRPINTSLVTAFSDFRRVMSSNHDKIMIVDGEYSILGGRNISRDYFVDNNDYKGAYRDTDVFIRCRNVAAQLEMAFVEEFDQLKADEITHKTITGYDRDAARLLAAYDAMYSHLRNENFTMPPYRDVSERHYNRHVSRYLDELEQYQSIRDYSSFNPFRVSFRAPVKIADSHAIGGPRNDITDLLIEYIDGSRREIVIQNPYVVLTKRIFAALRRASDRGVPIIVHSNSPRSTDSLLTQAMFYSDWKEFVALDTTRVYVYTTEKKLHAKNFVFDGQIGIVGSYNLDYLSEQVNSEVMAMILCNDFSKLLREEIMQDVRESAKYQVEVMPDGEIKSVYGPDDLPGKHFWLLRSLSRLTMFKHLI